MRYVDLPTDKRYSVIGLGTWQFGSREWGYGGGTPTPRRAGSSARARELGITVFDTAEVYGFGRSERILGDALRASGGTDDVVVATRCSRCCRPPPVVEQRGVASAQRLGVRTIDLYQVHRPQPGGRRRHGDARHARAARRRRRRRGRRLELPARRWQRAEVDLGAPVLSNQVQFSLVSRGPMAELLPWAARTGHVVIAYSPLAQGLLSGALRRRRTGRRTASARRTRSSCRRTCAPPARRCRCCARSPRRTTRRRRRSRWPGRCTTRTSSRSRGVQRGAGGEQRRRGGDRAGAPTSTRALTAAAEAFHPTTGVSAIPALVRARR